MQVLRFIVRLGKNDWQSSTSQGKDNRRITGETDVPSDKGATQNRTLDPNFLTLAIPRLSVCADAQKVDRAKLAQTEVNKPGCIFFLKIQKVIFVIPLDHVTVYIPMHPE